MNQSLNLDARQGQHQTLTPRLQYAVRLLQLSSLEYEQELHEVIARNPFLETDESAPPPSGEVLAGAASQAAPEPMPAPDAAPDDAPAAGTADGDGDGPPERDEWLSAPGGVRDGASTSTATALDLMVADIGLREHLRGQANLLPLSARDHTLVCTIIESLDDDGYLRIPLAEIGTLADLHPPADAGETGTALKLVQSFDPVGIGARSVCECLQLQLAQSDGADRELALAILDGHVERLAQRDVPGLARRLQRPAAEIEAACDAIRRLDPHPGWRYGRPDVQYIVPDVIVRKVRGTWSVQLNPAVVPRLRVNRTYAEMFQRHRDPRHAELASHLQEARWAVRNIEQRFSTILSVAQAILRRQYRFFEFGAFAMKPLGLRDVADEVGLHESTVCRVTNNKYMATPAGVFELKHFFSRAMPLAGGGTCSATAIREVMQELIAAEDPMHPLSDVEIADRLARQGLKVARRTTTKYRQMLRIPPVERRRRHTAPTPQETRRGSAAGAREAPPAAR